MHARKRVRHEVGVGGDVKPEGGDVVAGVGDHGQAIVTEHVQQPAGQLRAPRPAGEQDDQDAVESAARPVTRMPECLIL